MRVFGFVGSFQRVARHYAVDVPPDAAWRAGVVAWIDGRRSLGVTCIDACRLAGVSTRSYQRWRVTLRRYGVRALARRSSRPHRPRAALKRTQVREHVERLRLTHPCGKDKLAILLAREGIQVSASTVGRVLTELRSRGVITAIGSARRAGKRRRLGAYRRHARRKRRDEKATRPGMLVQIDTLHEYSHTLRKRMHFSAIDPVTRYAHAHVGLSGSSTAAAAFLKECLDTWPHPITSIQVDNGSEFMGAFERICRERSIDLVTIPPATPKANAHVERLQRTFRDEHYAYEPPSLDLAEANTLLQGYLDYYNHQRPHHALAMSTPMAYSQSWNSTPRQTS